MAVANQPKTRAEGIRAESGPVGGGTPSWRSVWKYGVKKRGCHVEGEVDIIRF